MMDDQIHKLADNPKELGGWAILIVHGSFFNRPKKRARRQTKRQVLFELDDGRRFVLTPLEESHECVKGGV